MMIGTLTEVPGRVRRRRRCRRDPRWFSDRRVRRACANALRRGPPLGGSRLFASGPATGGRKKEGVPPPPPRPGGRGGVRRVQAAQSQGRFPRAPRGLWLLRASRPVRRRRRARCRGRARAGGPGALSVPGRRGISRRSPRDAVALDKSACCRSRSLKSGPVRLISGSPAGEFHSSKRSASARDARKRETAMCGRYVIFSTLEAIRALFRFGEQPNFPPRYNVAPTQPIPVVRLVDGKRAFALVRWGLLPSW